MTPTSRLSLSLATLVLPIGAAWFTTTTGPAGDARAEPARAAHPANPASDYPAPRVDPSSPPEAPPPTF